MSSPSGSMIPRGNISGYKQRNIPQYTNDQMQLFQMLLGSLLGGEGLGGGMDFMSKLASGSPESFKDIEQPAFRQLQGQLGQLGSRFADAGALGSSGFQQMASGATANLASSLQSQRLGLQQGATERLLQLAQSILGQRPYEQIYQKKSSGLSGLLSKALPLLLHGF